MIRDAGIDDIPAIVEMGARMAVKAKLDAHVGYDKDSVANTLEFLINSPDGILICDDDGMIGGLCYPHLFNHTVKIGQELFWYSEAKCGLALLAAAEAKARELGASHWVMALQESMRPEAVGRYYSRRGYSPLERSYIKGLVI